MLHAAAVAALAAAGCGPPAPVNAPAPTAAPAAAAPRARDAITTADLRRDLAAFADDSMLGRNAETGDAVRAARFLATRAAAAGLEPAGDSGTFLQHVPLVRDYLANGSRVRLTTGAGEITLALGPQLLPVLSLGDSLPRPKLDAEGDLLFAGYGFTEPGVRDELANKSVAGKVVVFVMDEPPSLDSATRAVMRRDHPLAERIARLAERGPAAIIAVLSGRSAALLPEIAAEIRDSAVHLSDGAPALPRTLPLVLLCDARAAGPLLPPGWPTKPAWRALAGRRLSAHIDWVHVEVPAYNVVGVRRGGDPALRGSYVAFGAHLDHIGIQHEPGTEDSIANGADDDGTGSVALLAIARAAVAQRPAPRRSMLFVWHTGEELGLFGSEWFTSHPTVPLDSIVAQLNADMIGRNARDSLYIVGPRAAPRRQSVVLGTIADSVNLTLKPPFLINREWDSPSHPEQIYYRSDHFNYARRGIPVIFITTGLHADYHKVSDEVAKIDFAKLARVAGFIYDVGLAVAERPTRPAPNAHSAPR